MYCWIALIVVLFLALEMKVQMQESTSISHPETSIKSIQKAFTYYHVDSETGQILWSIEDVYQVMTYDEATKDNQFASYFFDEATGRKRIKFHKYGTSVPSEENNLVIRGADGSFQIVDEPTGNRRLRIAREVQ